MHTTRCRLLALTLLAVYLSLAPDMASADPTLYPADAPAFRFELPADWTTQPSDNSTRTLRCKSADGKLSLLFLCVHNTALKDGLAGYAQDALKDLGFDAVTVTDSSEGFVGNHLPAHLATVHLTKAAGTSLTVRFVALPVGAEKTCVIYYTIRDERIEEFVPVALRILDSIQQVP